CGGGAGAGCSPARRRGCAMRAPRAGPAAPPRRRPSRHLLTPHCHRAAPLPVPGVPPPPAPAPPACVGVPSCPPLAAALPPAGSDRRPVASAGPATAARPAHVASAPCPAPGQPPPCPPPVPAPPARPHTPPP